MTISRESADAASRNLESGLSCLADHQTYQNLFTALSNQPGGYFAVSNDQAVVIVAPLEGLVFYSGYD